jgi:hypothetical protein
MTTFSSFVENPRPIPAENPTLIGAKTTSLGSSEKLSIPRFAIKVRFDGMTCDIKPMSFSIFFWLSQFSIFNDMSGREWLQSLKIGKRIGYSLANFE